MVNVIRRISNERIRKWYDGNIDHTFLHELVTRYNKEGYTFNYELGLMFRGQFSEDIISRLGYSIIDIIFPRPVDFHRHEDVDEALSVLKGNGALYIVEEGRDVQENFSPGKQVFVPKNTPHSFRPNKNDCLEIRLACSGILNPEKEICLQSFDTFPPWLEYYSKPLV